MSYDLAEPHLNVLIVAYYEKIGLALDDDGQAAFGDACKFLESAGLMYYTGVMREIVTIHSLHSPILVERMPGPTTYTAAAITEEGKRLVEGIDTARKVEACIALGNVKATKALVSSLSMEELPSLLASDCGFVRDAAKDRLTALEDNVQVEEDSGGKMYFIDLQGGSVACIKGLSN